MVYALPEIIELFYAFLYPFTRISTFLLASPFYSIQALNIRFRISLSFLLTILYFSYFESTTYDPLSIEGLSQLFQQAAIGVALGFSLQLISAAITLGGQAISNSVGLGMANMFDPTLGNVPVISQFLIILSTLIFLMINGHLVLLELLFSSFERFPIGASIPVEIFVQAIIDWSPLIFSGGLQIALPLMITMLLVNIGLGIVTRSAPSLNIIAVGFPAIILVGMVLLALALPGIIQLIQEFWLNALEQLDLILVN
jgi:flagellar biosynthetic protein FliR